MNAVHRIGALGVICGLALFSSGCLHQMVNWSSGGELIWYCDTCEERVADPDLHVCNLTRYDEETNRDVLIDEADRAEYEEILAEREEARAEAEEAQAEVDSGKRKRAGSENPRWMFWR